MMVIMRHPRASTLNAVFASNLKEKDINKIQELSEMLGGTDGDGVDE